MTHPIFFEAPESHRTAPPQLQTCTPQCLRTRDGEGSSWVPEIGLNTCAQHGTNAVRGYSSEIEQLISKKMPVPQKKQQSSKLNFSGPCFSGEQSSNSPPTLQPALRTSFLTLVYGMPQQRPASWIASHSNDTAANGAVKQGATGAGARGASKIS